jgi:hypothetical protein
MLVSTSNTGSIKPIIPGSITPIRDKGCGHDLRVPQLDGVTPSKLRANHETRGADDFVYCSVTPRGRAGKMHVSTSPGIRFSAMRCSPAARHDAINPTARRDLRRHRRSVRFPRREAVG